MNRTVICEGEVRVPLPLERSIDLFTPEGERRWVPGWDPVYPAGRATRGVGTVFITAARDRTTTWVVVDGDPQSMRYARVTPREQAGTVSVRCRAEGAATVAAVRYDLTALNADAAAALHGFAHGFDRHMAEWERWIGAALSADV